MVAVRTLFAILAWGLLSTNTAGNFRPGQAEWIRWATGKPCRPVETESLPIFSIAIGANVVRCTVHSSGPIEFASGRFESSHGAIPILIIRSVSSQDRGVIVFLPGGPGGGLLAQGVSNPATAIWMRLADRGYTIIGLGYSGSLYGKRAMQPGADLEKADRQTASYLRYLSATKSRVRAVVGISAGAHVALAMRRVEGIPTLLLSPPIDAPSRLVALMKEKPAGLAYYSRILSGGQSEEARTAAFFGPYYDRTLGEAILSSSGATRCLSILVGSEDDRVGLSELDGLEEIRGAPRVRLIEGMGHGPRSAAEGRRLGDIIAGEVERLSCYRRPSARISADPSNAGAAFR